MALVKDAFGKERVPTPSNPAPTRSSPSGNSSRNYAGGSSHESANTPYHDSSRYVRSSGTQISDEQRAEQMRQVAAARLAQRREAFANSISERKQRLMEDRAFPSQDRSAASAPMSMEEFRTALRQIAADSSPLTRTRQRLGVTLSQHEPSQIMLEKLSAEQRITLALLSRLPNGFPFEKWDAMTSKQRQAAVERTQLSREEQWHLLNTRASVGTVYKVMNLWNTRGVSGLSDTTASRLTDQLLAISDERLKARNRTMQFGSDRQRAFFLQYLNEKEAELYDGITSERNRYPLSEELPIKFTPYPEATPLPQPSRVNVREWSPVQTQLYQELAEKVKQDLGLLERTKGWNSTHASLNEVFSNRNTILEMSNRYSVPAEYIETVLFREQRFVDIRDNVADSLVQLNLRERSSTGIMQVMGDTGVEAINFVVDKGIVSYEELGIKSNHRLNPESRSDCMLIWERMRDDDRFCIEVGTANLLFCAEEVTRGKAFLDFNTKDAISTLARYNGSGDDALVYGEECYHWLSSFVDYERNGG